MAHKYKLQQDWLDRNRHSNKKERRKIRVDLRTKPICEKLTIDNYDHPEMHYMWNWVKVDFWDVWNRDKKPKYGLV